MDAALCCMLDDALATKSELTACEIGQNGNVLSPIDGALLLKVSI